MARETVKNSVWGLIHDTNNALHLIKIIRKNIENHISKGTLTNDYLIKSLDVIQERVEKTEKAVDDHYTEMKESKLWEKPLQ